MLTPVEILQAARDLLSDPTRWTQGALARNACYDSVAPWHPEAIRWCLTGALLRSGMYQGLLNAEVIDSVREAIKRRGYNVPLSMSIAVSYNDERDRTHADILAVLDDALSIVRTGRLGYDY